MTLARSGAVLSGEGSSRFTGREIRDTVGMGFARVAGIARSAAAAHGAHIGQDKLRSIHRFVGAGQLTAYTLGTERSEELQSLDAGFKFFHCTKLGGIPLYPGDDEGIGLVNQGGGIHSIQKIGKILVVEGGILLTGGDPVGHGPVTVSGDG